MGGGTARHAGGRDQGIAPGTGDQGIAPGTGDQGVAPGGGAWRPPGRDCGLCGDRTCGDFARRLAAGERRAVECPFYQKAARKAGTSLLAARAGRCGEVGSASEVAPAVTLAAEGTPGAGAAEALARAVHPPGDSLDILGNPWDFILGPLPGEPSARKIVLPFRPDLVEKWAIEKGDIVTGRPAGPGCPVQHVLRVLTADPVTGILVTWVVGPKFSRGREVKDVAAYHMLGFEGLATDIRRQPAFGLRHTFLPGFCMMHLNHTGVVNMALGKEAGLHVRLEDIRIMAGPGKSGTEKTD